MRKVNLFLVTGKGKKPWVNGAHLVGASALRTGQSNVTPVWQSKKPETFIIAVFQGRTLEVGSGYLQHPLIIAVVITKEKSLG